MKDTEELAEKFIEHCRVHYNGDITISDISFTTRYKKNNLNVLEKKFGVDVCYDSNGDINTWIMPRGFTSEVSYENALKMLSIAINGYYDALMVEKNYKK